MANRLLIFEKNTIMMGNLNSFLSYLITTVHTALDFEDIFGTLLPLLMYVPTFTEKT